MTGMLIVFLVCMPLWIWMTAGILNYQEETEEEYSEEEIRLLDLSE